MPAEFGPSLDQMARGQLLLRGCPFFGWDSRETKGVTRGVTQVLVFGPIYQGAILVHVFEPQPYVPANEPTTTRWT